MRICDDGVREDGGSRSADASRLIFDLSAKLEDAFWSAPTRAVALFRLPLLALHSGLGNWEISMVSVWRSSEPEVEMQVPNLRIGTKRVDGPPPGGCRSERSACNRT